MLNFLVVKKQDYKLNFKTSLIFPFYYIYFRSQCAPFEFCLQSYGDGVCQSQCNTIQCGYDGGDCENEQRNYYLSIKYILLHLKTNQSEFKLNRNQYLGNLGVILRSIVRIAKDNTTKELLLEDIPSKNQIKVSIRLITF